MTTCCARWTRRSAPGWITCRRTPWSLRTARRWHGGGCARGEWTPPDDDVLAHRYELVDGQLRAAGLDWYEVSNWSRPGGQCTHNVGYWDGGQWWGAGPGAHSFVGATRWGNVKHPNAYAQILDGDALPVAGFEQLEAASRHTEDV